MSEARWDRIKEVFNAALGVAQGERAALVERLCEGDEDLKREVQSLLDARTLSIVRTGGAADAIAGMGSGSMSDPHAVDRVGTTIERYKLLQLIGEGGFGTVYLAEQTAPVKRKVAVKIIKPGMDSKMVVARFEQERQALAVMDHPFIAKVFDAGATPGGRPFFVMEHVAGEPITGYADRHNLGIRARLELFLGVCEAVQHAHLKGIVHRDLKPSNILVEVRDGKPRPKVIDFGVAKAITHTLTEKTIFTESGQLIGTPEYMSPEQAEMGATDIDTRTDVYSLGVVLYELLSGLLPFDSRLLRNAGFAAICKVLREQEAPKPSIRLSTADGASGEEIARRRLVEREELTAELRRELDWIPLKALRKDRTERYQSPSDLARDVRNYLEGRPLEAGPESTAYRVRKYIRRNKGPVAAVAAVLVALVLGLAGTMWKAAEARREAERANAEAVAARAAEQEKARLAEVAQTAAQQADEARRNAELSAYAANIVAADASLAANEPARVRARLDACAERLRGWEWGWLNARADQSLVVMRGHTDRVTVAAFNPSGDRIVTASHDKTARVWDAGTGKELAVLRGHEEQLTNASFSPDGRMIVTSSYDGTARVWDSATGNELAVLRGHKSRVSTAVFSPDGSRIATASWDSTARIWDSKSGGEVKVLAGHEGSLYDVAFNPDGTRLVTASTDWTARVWDAETGVSVAVIKGHTGTLYSAAFSPDGSRILTASGDNSARVWDAVGGPVAVELSKHTYGVTSAAFSPDGTRILAASDDGTVQVWDGTTGKHLAELKGHTDQLNSAEFSPDGTRIVTGSWDGTVRVWDAGNGEELSVLRGHEGDVYSAVFSSDGKRILTASGDGTARIWDAHKGRTICSLAAWAQGMTISRDGMRLATALEDGTARVYDTVGMQELAVLRGHQRAVNAASFSPDGTRIVTASNDNTARIWDAWSGKELVVLSGHEGTVTDGSFSPDATRIVTASWDKTARVWDAKTFAQMTVLQGHLDWIRTATFSPDGTRIVTASDDKTARIWDAWSGNELVVLTGHEGAVTDASFSPDGTRVVTASRDKTARVWDATSGRQLATLRGHDDGLSAVDFSPDGLRIVTASADKTARVWDANGFVELAVLRGGQEKLDAVRFSPDGIQIFTKVADTAVVWDSVPYRERFPAIERARAAEAKMGPIVADRLAAGELPETLHAAYVADSTITAEERAAALSYIQVIINKQAIEARKAANALNTSAWKAVRFAPVAEDVAAKAIAEATRASKLVPDDPATLNTLGVALYRAGRFEETIATLTRSDAAYVQAADGKQPGNWAFIAMSHWQLGHGDEARAAAATFRELAAKSGWRDDEEVKAWAKELDEIIPAPAK